MFHPLAFTKTFALVGVALLSITLVPALIPIFLKGRIKSEDENWLVRTMIAIFKPMLSWLMDRTTLVCWLFVDHPRPGLRRLDEARARVHARPGRRVDHGHADHRAAGVDRRGRATTCGSATRCCAVSPRSGRSSARRAGPRRRPTRRRWTWSRRSSTSATTTVWPKRKLRFEDAAGPDARGARRSGARRVCCAPVPGRGARRPGQRGGDDRREPGSTRPSATWQRAGSPSSARSWAGLWSARRSTPCSAASHRPPSPASRRRRARRR